MRLTIQARILLLLTAITALVVAVLGVIALTDEQRNRAALESERSVKARLLVEVLDLAGSKLETFARDYSFWDEMVTFVRSGDRIWAEENLGTGMESFEIDAVWIFDPGFRFVHGASADGRQELQRPVWPEAANREVLAKPHFRRFFAWTAVGPIEVRTAPIQPTRDVKRETEPRGFLAAARVLDEEARAELSSVLGSEVRIARTGTSSPLPHEAESEEICVDVGMDLPGYDGAVALELSSHSHSAFLEEARRSARRQLAMVASFGALIVLLAVGALRRWVVRPLAQLTRGLASGDSRGIDALRADGSEFGRLAGLVVEFLEQKQELVRHIEERERALVARQALEEQLLAAQKMESIGRLAGGVAHDFNNLLTVILANADFALERLREGDPTREEVQELKQAGERAAVLTRQLLAFGRKQIMRPTPLDLNRVVTGIERMLRRIIGEDLELELLLAPDLGLVMADSSQIEQVIMNLVVNARDAMPGGGRIRIETKNVGDSAVLAERAHGDPRARSVLLAVEDDGSGMDEQTRARLFEPFFTTKELGKGTGLGLSTVYGIVKQSGGEIRVDSEPGCGSRFELIFPRESSGSAADSLPPVIPANARGKETILVVEDEDALRRLTRRILTEAGYTVLMAADGEAALRIFETETGPIHLVVTDIVMPRMGGGELAEQVARLRSSTKILFMSGYPDEVTFRHGALLQSAQFIGKPFTAESLAKKVRELLDLA